MTPPKLPEWARRSRAKWRFVGSERPSFAHSPRADQESVWDYPRPPRLESESRVLSVEGDGVIVAKTRRGLRLLETASPPTYYFPPDDVNTDLLAPADGRSRCEWKGEGRSFDVVLPAQRIGGAAWCYDDPFDEFAALRGFLAFYPEPLDCRVGSFAVRRQPGRFYGGWVTDDLAGPFKGAPGSESW